MVARPVVRFGLIGAGAIAHSYVDAFKDCETGCLCGIADVRPEAALALASVAGCDGYASVQELLDAQSLDAQSLDAVIVCTPPVTHADISVLCLEAGKHVLCEKPIAIDSVSAERMFEVAERAELKLSMASKFRHVDDVIRARAIISSGILGELILFENAFTGHVDMSSRWNSDPRVSGGGVLIDNGTHSVDLMRYFLGPLVELQVVEGKRVQGLAVEDTVRMFAHSANGVLGSIDLSWSMDKEQPYYISIYGSLGTVLVGWKESKYRRSSSDEWIVFGKGYSKIDAFRSQISNFIDAIHGDKGLIVTPEDALASVRAIEVAYAALQDRPWKAIASSDIGPVVPTSELPPAVEGQRK